MFIKSMFPTPLITWMIDPNVVSTDALREAILLREQQNRGVGHSNMGGWQSEHNFFDWTGNAGAALASEYRGMVNRLTALFDGQQLSRTPLNWRVQAWANVNRAQNANAAHYHPGAYWSGCFYVDDGGIDGQDSLGGALEFFDPRGPVPLMYAPTVKMAIDQCTTAGLGELLYPKRGMAVMFPSWVNHAVTPYLGTGTRISVALNFCL